jgi:hypothetical protein
MCMRWIPGVVGTPRFTRPSLQEKLKVFSDPSLTKIMCPFLNANSILTKHVIAVTNACE